MLSASEFITILRELGNYGEILSEEEFETHTIVSWRYQKMFIKR
jgi:hypothetical protein